MVVRLDPDEPVWDDGFLYSTDFDFDDRYDYWITDEVLPHLILPEGYYREHEVTTEVYEAGQLGEDHLVRIDIHTYREWRYYPEWAETYNYTSYEPTSAEERNGLGVGWSFGFPSIEWGDGGDFLHLGDGRVYKIHLSGTGSGLYKHLIKDMVFKSDTSYSYGGKNLIIH